MAITRLRRLLYPFKVGMKSLTKWYSTRRFPSRTEAKIGVLDGGGFDKCGENKEPVDTPVILTGHLPTSTVGNILKTVFGLVSTNREAWNIDAQEYLLA